jgi:putative transposase
LTTDNLAEKRHLSCQSTKRVPVVKKQLWGGEFWSKGYFISTVGRHGNEEVTRQYVKKRGSEKTYKKLHRQDIQRELF